MRGCLLYHIRVKGNTSSEVDGLGIHHGVR